MNTHASSFSEQDVTQMYDLLHDFILERILK